MTLRIKNISKHFGGVHALDKCSFSVQYKKITALIGPNGSGKSTLFNVISGVLKEDSGTIFLGKENLTRIKDYDRSKRGIARTFQDVRLFKNLTIRDHLAIAQSKKDEMIFKSIQQPEKTSKRKMNTYLQQVHLDKPLDTQVTELSYGQRKLLTLAIALAKPHKILLLDEPVAGVNPALRKVIKKIIRNLNKKGETILIIEHDMNFIMDLADKVIVLDEGRVIAEGKPKEIQDNKRVLEAYLGE